jgi:hypothetical protein
MALFGTSRDIDTFKIFSKELVNNIVTQQVGFYKVVLDDTPSNIYGENLSKRYVGPVLFNCLIERGDFTTSMEEYGPDAFRDAVFRFLKDDMVEAGVYPEVGDIVMYYEHYYEVGNVNENQLIVGKDSDYVYSDGLGNYGASFSIVLETHYVREDKLGIEQVR